ncbi:MAG: radical SAM protein [Bacteroidales bacterium]|nr:radical SAM protein [Bacteroidales bacterium]
MSFLFDQVIFGPIQSRRFGISLGVNLLPTKHKICSFDCIYCECGWTEHPETDEYSPRQVIQEALKNKLSELQQKGIVPDNITWAGNGEPTLHPDFAAIVDDVITVKNQFFPTTQTTVLSNSTTLHRSDVFQALQRVDHNVMKLDAGTETMYQKINQCKVGKSLDQITEDLCRFQGALTLQTLFLRGHHHGVTIDNTNETEVAAWLKRVEKIAPKTVMLYPIDRATPAEHLQRMDRAVLETIATKVQQLGIETKIYE